MSVARSSKKGPQLSPIREALDWGSLAPLRLRARALAEGLYSGAHRSRRRGGGIEFGGHREYSPGDDLRWLDRRSLLRHGHLLVRQFETETERGLALVVDATASMQYRGTEAPGAKYAWAALIAAALGRVTVSGGDPVSLHLIGGRGVAAPMLPSGGREAFERLVAMLEACAPAGDMVQDSHPFGRVMDDVDRLSRRGTMVVVLSDLIDLPPTAATRIASLASTGRIVVVTQVLDHDEATFPFDGTLRLRALEGDRVVETDAAAARSRYLDRLIEVANAWDSSLSRRGACFLRALTSEDPIQVVRQIIQNLR